MFKSTSTSLILLGILAVIVGIIAIAWPSVTILALVILFAVYAFIAAGLQAMRAFSSRSAGPVFGHLLLALVDLAAGVIALVWPKPTALVLVIVVAAWALVGGFFEIFAGFQSGETAGTTINSQHGVMTFAADYFLNMTVLAGTGRSITVPAPLAGGRPPPLQHKVYVAFNVSDGDNLQENEHRMRQMWDDPRIAMSTSPES